MCGGGYFLENQWRDLCQTEDTPAAVESENGSLGSWWVRSKHRGLLGAFQSVQNPKVVIFCL